MPNTPIGRIMRHSSDRSCDTSVSCSNTETAEPTFDSRNAFTYVCVCACTECMHYSLMKHILVVYSIRRTVEGRATCSTCHLDLLFGSAGAAPMFIQQCLISRDSCLFHPLSFTTPLVHQHIYTNSITAENTILLVKICTNSSIKLLPKTFIKNWQRRRVIAVSNTIVLLSVRNLHKHTWLI